LNVSYCFLKKAIIKFDICPVGTAASAGALATADFSIKHLNSTNHTMPDPDALAKDIVENPEAGLVSFKTIIEPLNKKYQAYGMENKKWSC
jgi:hypothetical protein